MKISIVISTRDRLESLSKCLSSIAIQSSYVEIVVVVASGGSARSQTDERREDLELKYIYTKKGGQIHQRNLGIAVLLEKGSEYIAFLNDDVILLPNSLKNMCRYIEQKKANGKGVIGVGFNISNRVDYETIPYKTIKKVLLRIGRRPGAVTRVGYNTPIVNVKNDIQTEWLSGGYTVWSSEILRQHPQDPVDSRFSAAEDLIYSYPISKKYSLFVCHNALVSSGYIGQKNIEMIKYRSFKSTVARLYFCSRHAELSGSLYVITDLMLYLCYILKFNWRQWEAFKGFSRGVVYYFSNQSRGREILND